VNLIADATNVIAMGKESATLIVREWEARS
jgi:hypothetical protein